MAVDSPVHFVKLHMDTYAGATGNTGGQFDIEAGGTATVLHASIDALCNALAAGAEEVLGDVVFAESQAQGPEA